jgi:hypothetical protein
MDLRYGTSQLRIWHSADGRAPNFAMSGDSDSTLNCIFPTHFVKSGGGAVRVSAPPGSTAPPSSPQVPYKPDPSGSRVSPVLAPAHAPVLAEITELSVESTGVGPTVNPVLVWPAGTVTVAGTLALVEELDRLTG